MVISKKIIVLMNLRIQQEELSSRLYLAMSIWLDLNGYSGASKLWAKYSQEELTHADWAYSYLKSLNILPLVPSLTSPQTEFKGLPNIIALSYEHELLITSQCEQLAKAANDDNDFMTLELAQRYLKEQVDELGKTQYWVDRLEAFGDDKISLRLLDNEMGQ